MSSVRRRVAIMDWCASRNAVSVIPTRGFFFVSTGFFTSCTEMDGASAAAACSAFTASAVVIFVAITFPLASLISCFTTVSDMDDLPFHHKVESARPRPREAAASARTPLRRFAPRSLGYCILLRLAGFIQVVMSFFFVNYLQFRKILKNLCGGSIQFARAVRRRRQKRSPRNGGFSAVFLSLSD